MIVFMTVSCNSHCKALVPPGNKGRSGNFSSRYSAITHESVITVGFPSGPGWISSAITGIVYQGDPSVGLTPPALAPILRIVGSISGYSNQTVR